ncbi:class I SAM-dependent methyltransferase [Microbacterium terricola]|uniref:SAM-dependent methyltransferase n=1 Tax=Microbacterium terricola TaxID=344163 RepID=A0ABM8E1I4_9MICO|nr:methyltransferase domain-containing protein [Microbacterium terricola]UYK40616.1 methyltransferase domain-containing protein [Microbacterium terricola]BDV31652.1 SAM-dependent methyltransferase [Microbacterium terricola]
MSFDVAAEAYESFMGRYSRPLAVHFADWCRLPLSGRALDVGCGPGALTEVLTARWGEANVAGIDPSASFVAAAQATFPAADIRHGGAESLPFADSTFDATMAELVVHFMTDAAAGVAEMRRVTRPGGIVAACVWDFAGGRAPQTRFFQALKAVAPDVEDETARVGGHDGDLGQLLTDAGCTEVVSGELAVRVDYPGFDAWWEPYTLGVAPAGRQLAALDGAARERVRAHARTLMPEGPFTVSATAWAARAIA